MRIWMVMMTYGLACLMIGCVMRQESLPRDPNLDRLAWLSGTWLSIEGDVVVEEQWTQPRGGTMFGVNRTVHGNETAFCVATG